MAKKSKIAKNEKRQEIVARYAERRAELKEIIRRPSSTDANGRPPSGSWAGSRGTPAPPGYATATRWTGGRAATSGPSGCPG